MPKAPPRPWTPQPPRGRRVYAHIVSGSFACPRCGTMHLVGPGGRHRTGGKSTRGYDPRTATFKCRNASCAYMAVLGVVFWPIGRRAGGLPMDHVLTPGEAAEARLSTSYAVVEVWGARARLPARMRRTNVECTCTEPCPVHGGDQQTEEPV